MDGDRIMKVHFIGIGGIGMSGIARLFLSKGIKVSGSDLKENNLTQELKNQGASIYLGHDAKNIDGADTVVYSSAIGEDNPEFREAKKIGRRLIKRAEALAELMSDKTVVTVTGSHGKTTTASLVSFLLMEAGLCPTAAIGGILKNIDRNFCSGNGNFFVAEADESDGSFLYYAPKYSIITNIDREHLDFYKSFQNELDTFREFINKTDKLGCLFCSSDDDNLRKLLEGYKGQYVLFGLDDKAHIFARDIDFKGLSSEFDCIYNGRFVDRFSLAMGGMHNISNALSVIALGLKLNIDIEHIKRALINYKGAGRRQEVKFRGKDIIIIDDYAHHPTEIKATLSALGALGAKRMVAVFQPHRFSRTKLLLKEFTECFGEAGRVIITDIYPASELPIEGITGEFLAEKVKENYSGKEVDFVPKKELLGFVNKIAQEGDLIVTLGAGDISKFSDELAEKFKR